MLDFKVEKKEEENSNNSYNNRSIISEKITPKERLSFASKIIAGLGLFYLLSMIFYHFENNEHGKFLFLTTKEIIMNFGGLLIGFYYRGK